MHCHIDAVSSLYRNAEHQKKHDPALTQTLTHGNSQFCIKIQNTKKQHDPSTNTKIDARTVSFLFIRIHKLVFLHQRSRNKCRLANIFKLFKCYQRVFVCLFVCKLYTIKDANNNPCVNM